jgi:hypothetical protein
MEVSNIANVKIPDTCQWTQNNTPESFQVGQVKNCLINWGKLTSNKWILDVVKGCKIEIAEWP